MSAELVNEPKSASRWSRRALALPRAVTNLLLPHRCALCDAASLGERGLCGRCFGRVSFIGQPACPGCARPLDNTPVGQAARLCGTCLRDGPMFTHAVAALAYSGAVADIILRLKHGDRLDLVPLVSQWMATAWTQSEPQAVNAPGVDLILPVPLHWRRQIARRYNQSVELARALPPTLGGTLDPTLVVRTRPTDQMKTMNREQRRANVRGAFRIARHADAASRLRGSHVLVIDDVYTTGATLRAIAGVLRRAQVSAVSILVAARVTRSDL